jgi:hypothetical protein
LLWVDFTRRTKIPTDKKGCYVLEHGRKSLTRFIRSKNLNCLVAGADGNIFTLENCLESGTFGVPGLPNLLVGDNQTDTYLSSSQARRREFEYWHWGKKFTPLSEEGNEKLSAFTQWTLVPYRLLAQMRKWGLLSIRKLCPLGKQEIR